MCNISTTSKGIISDQDAKNSLGYTLFMTRYDNRLRKGYLDGIGLLHADWNSSILGNWIWLEKNDSISPVDF